MTWIATIASKSSYTCLGGACPGPHERFHPPRRRAPSERFGDRGATAKRGFGLTASVRER
jgi:hypothetical protein